MRRAFLFLALGGCADGDAVCSHDPLRSPGGLAVTEAEHGVGWGSDDCFQCHQTWNIHQSDCIASVDVDLAAVRAEADPSDPASCVGCHGSNGVGWLETLALETLQGAELAP